MDDRTPVKLLLAARDVLTGIMLPWHLGFDHKALIDDVRDRLDAAVEADVGYDDVSQLLRDCIEVAETITKSCEGVRLVYGKMDRARLTLHCILEHAPRLRERGD